MSLLIMLFILVLASFLGAELISKVPQTLHTPLMSGSNAISGITILGAIVVAGEASYGSETSVVAVVAGALAVALAMLNVVGGFAVTDRMLRMFTRKGNK